MTRRTWLAVLVAATLCLAFAAPAAAKSPVRPFAGVWHTQDTLIGLPQGVPAPDCPSDAVLRNYGTGEGVFTHLGRTNVAFTHCTYMAMGVPDGTFDQGTVTLTAANGDRLLLRHEGTFHLTLNPNPGPPFASSTLQTHWWVTGGTGRFAHATGSGVGVGRTDEIASTMTLLLFGSVSY
jgi:hypothetical protein